MARRRNLRAEFGCGGSGLRRRDWWGGYGSLWVRRDGRRIMLRANRYALAVSLEGEVLPTWERALHGCDVPLCVRVSAPGELGLRHVFAGSQRDN